MKTTEKLHLMAEMERRNDERWNITSKEQEARQTAVEYSTKEALMSLYIQ